MSTPEEPVAESKNPQPTEQPARFVLDRRQRLSNSILWKIQQGFFDKQGVAAWNTGTVPWFITNNAFIAGSYARMAFSFNQDCASAGSQLTQPYDPSQPINIVEMGSGSGRFAYLFLRRMMALKEPFGADRIKFRYVATDFTESNLEFWRRHPRFKQYVDAGVLDFALFNAEKDDELKLLNSGERLSPDTLKNPIIVIANYVFDTLVQDAFRVVDGQLMESLVTLTSPQEEPDPTDAAVLQRLTINYEYEPIRGDYYPDPELNKILAGYQSRLDGTALLIPLGAFNCLRNLVKLSRGRMLMLSADKGWNHEEELLNKGDPGLAVHGSFSFSVNYHALGAYVRSIGGSSLHTSPREASLSASAFLLGGPAAAFPQTRQTFSEEIEGFGPIDFFVLQETMRTEGKLPLAFMISLLRLSGWDSYLFYYLSGQILAQAPEAPAGIKRDLRRVLPKIWENYYSIGETRDVPFEIGRVFWRLNCYREAKQYYQNSINQFGEHHVTIFNMGLCNYMLNQFEEALASFNRSLELNPSYGPAKEWRIRARAELAFPGISEEQ